MERPSPTLTIDAAFGRRRPIGRYRASIGTSAHLRQSLVGFRTEAPGRIAALSGDGATDADLCLGVREIATVEHCGRAQLGCPPIVEGPTKSKAGRRSIPIPTLLIPLLKARIDGRPNDEPAITSPKGSRLGLENWERAVDWRKQVVALVRPTLRVHDLRHTYASLARSAGADLTLLQVTMGHTSITVTAHTYADLYDSDLDRVADALDGLGFD
ncbi:tyrosine-type recombinase/integrase [Skermania piniformis]|uniref:Tyrosine-type recombinase/integrase n=1 Tax=Skermania pinensis TaxID=39122 RepID=A0ABX8SDN9_9ACTN|nr:tyrosine-type recombinase/integrase [Skermania piniformis]